MFFSAYMDIVYTNIDDKGTALDPVSTNKMRNAYCSYDYVGCSRNSSWVLCMVMHKSDRRMVPLQIETKPPSLSMWSPCTNDFKQETWPNKGTVIRVDGTVMNEY